MESIQLNHSISSHAVQFLEDIAKIPSISRQETQLAQFLRSYLEDHHFKVINSSVGNVIGVKGNGHPILLLASHMDTVATNNPFRKEGEKIYGTGVVDCKASLAAMFYTAANFNWDPNQGTLIITGIVQEEVETLGIDDFFTHDLQPDYAIFGEPTKEDRICIGYRGRSVLYIQVNTETGHTGMDWEYDNPIEIIISIYSQLKQRSNTLNTQHGKPDSYFEQLSVNMAAIQAGTEANIIPFSAKATIDIRIPPWISIDQVQHEIKTILHTIQKSVKKKTTLINYSTFPNYNACNVSPNSFIVNALRWAIFQETKKKAEIIKKTGSTFTNLIQAYYNQTNPDFVCITYGPGDSHLEHTDHEFILIPEYLDAIRILQRFIPKFLELYQKGNL
jgi:LysW-gamma-L-lysine carboxypeptidase